MSIEEINEVENVNESVETNDEVAEPKTVSFMEQAVAAMVEIKVGRRLQCTVTEVRAEGVIVSCGQKKDGYISSEDYGADFADVKVGDKFNAELIENKSGNKEYLALSKKIVDDKLAVRKAKEEAEREISAGDFDVVISEVCNGGLRAKKGDYTIFIPKSHVELSKKGAEPISDEKLQEYVGKTVTVRKVEDKDKDKASKNSKSVVCSIRNVIRDVRKKEKQERERLREERKAREAQEKIDIFVANADRLQPNLIVPGKVRKIVSFGVFVDVYGFRALCPVSEISWIRDTDPSTVFEVNKEYEFLITKVDSEKYQVTLSYKILQKKPYELAMEKYPIGSIVHGTIQSIVNFGAFVSLEPGVDGLVHKTNVSYDKVEDLNTVLTVGQEIEAKVISFKDDKIGLSIKDLQPNPYAKAEKTEHAPKQRAEKNTQERKAKRNDDSYESQEEKDNFAAFGGTTTASNYAFSGILDGLFSNSDDDNK